MSRQRETEKVLGEEELGTPVHRTMTFIKNKQHLGRGSSLSAYQATKQVVSEEYDELVTARMVNEFVYCPRLFYLEFVQHEWAENEDTIKGSIVHGRVDTESGTLPESADLQLDDIIKARSVLMSAPQLGLIARMDLVEGSCGQVRPVDYKKGSPSKHGPWDPEKLQICVQALILRENGYECDEGILYYCEPKQKYTVPIDDELVEVTLKTVDELRTTAKQVTPPLPLVDSPKCPRCSLVGICLPDEVVFLQGQKADHVRRLVPARDDAAPVYVQEQGAFVGTSKGRLVLRSRGKEEQSLRLLDVSQVCLYGNVQISAQALRALAERGISVFHFSYGGWLTAVTSGLSQRNVELRVKQYNVAADRDLALALAIEFVRGKLKNQRTLIRRNHPEGAESALEEMKRLVKLVASASSVERLLGLEGMGARIYFGCFSELLKGPLQFEMTGRGRRPPTDPVNALLSYLYTLLVKDGMQALMAVGLDPHQGMYHKLRYGRPSLALDLIEEFRPLIADSTVLRLVNNRIISSSDFIRRGTSYALKDNARREVIKAYETRMDTLIRHPIFGYKISYRRVLEVQARLLARTIESDISAYRAFVTR